MNKYEKEQYKAIIKWKEKKPSVMSRLTGRALKPLSWTVERVIPPRAIQGALTGADWIAQGLTDTEDIKRDGKVNQISELRHKDLQLSDKLANEVHNWANGIALAEGAATGASGLPGMAVDIPALITMCLRAIHKIGLCYGYECKTQSDKQLVYGILSVAGANNVHEKVVALANIQAIKVIIAKNTWKKIAEKAATKTASGEALVITIKNLAKQLGVNLT